MAREVLSNGVIVPEKYTRDWFDDFRTNLVKLNDAITAIAGKQNALTQEQLDAVNSAITSQKVTAYDDHIADTSKHLTDGTAAKAIADEDGTSIKTGYGKLAGNQTWTGTNTYTGASAIRFNNTSYVSGTPSENIFYSTVQWGGYVNNTWSAPFTINNAVRTNGYSDISFRIYSQTSNTLTGFVHETNADASDISFRPIANGTHKLGSSTYQWSSVYAQTYYYNGTAWGLDKVNEWSETNAFTKAYSDATYSALFGFSNLASVHTSPLAVFFDVRGSSNYASYGAGLWAGYVSTGSVRYGHLKFVRTTDKRSETNNGTILDTNFSFIDMAFHYSMINFMESVRITNDGTENSLKPITNNATDLGTSTNKWKTLNGINPGALSLPDYNSTAKVNISSSIVPDQYGNIVYTPPINGWLYVCFNVSNATTSDSIFYIQAKDNNVANSSFVQTSWMPASSGTSSLAIFFPVVANKQFVMQINFSNYTIIKAHVIPCLGNV